MAKLKIRYDAEHQDWKTRAVFPERWPTLKAGETVEFVKEWNNFYGRWAEVIGPNGSHYDIDPKALGEQMNAGMGSEKMSNTDVKYFECHGCDKIISENEASVFALCPECEKKRREGE